MIVTGDDKILGGGIIFPKYLGGHFEQVKNHLYKNEDKDNIDKLLTWFTLKMIPETQRLIRLIVPPKVNGTKVFSSKEHESQKEEQISLVFAENASILSALENRLDKQRFLASDHMTLADIFIYSEMSTILALLDEHHS